MLPDDTFKASHTSTKIDFMWWVKNFVLLYFRIQTAINSLQRLLSLPFWDIIIGLVEGWVAWFQCKGLDVLELHLF